MKQLHTPTRLLSNTERGDGKPADEYKAPDPIVRVVRPKAPRVEIRKEGVASYMLLVDGQLVGIDNGPVLSMLYEKLPA